ncbi:MAG: hypothetical protein RBT16_11695, partial [Desulfococcus multivorans]|nr:hypothetical protein [Desulfococcus multivorans]
HPVYRPLIIDARKHILLTGVGSATRLVFAPPSARDPALALLYIVGGSRNIQIQGMLVHTDVLAHLIYVDEACEDITIRDCRLINGWIPNQEMKRTTADCVTLGQCCDVRVSDCVLVGRLGIVQADTRTLQNAREALSRLRPSDPPAKEADKAPANDGEPEPAVVETLKSLRVEDNRIHARIGVQFVDALGGGIDNNQLHAITEERLATFTRNANPAPLDPDGAPATVSLETLYAAVAEKLKGLPPCVAAQPDEAGQQEDEARQKSVKPIKIPDDTIGVRACLLEGMTLRGNIITATETISLAYSRGVSISGNTIGAGTNGVRLGYAFDLDIERNRIRITAADDPGDDEQPDIGILWRQYDPGACGISFRFASGIRINDNDIDAHSAIATGRGAWKQCRGDIQAEALLRVLKIKRPWRVTVELVWFLYQILYSLSAGASGGTSGVIEETTKPALERRLFTMRLGLLDHTLFPAGIAKAEISGNRITVTRFGILLYKVFSIGGIGIIRNRISGYRRTGILIHPWFSVGFAAVFARFIRCLITWTLVFLTLMRDMLRALLDGDTAAPQPGAGLAGGALGILAMGVSWIQMLCSRYCGGAAPTEEGEEEVPPSPAEILADALDDFLADADPGRLDDLVHQACTIDGNSLAGSGDGIWTGIDGSHITGNSVIVWPSGSLAYETMVFGILLKQHFTWCDHEYCNDDIKLLANSAMDLHRDMVLFGAYNAAGWVQQFDEEPNFRERLRTLLSAWAVHLDPSSPLAAPVAAMQAGLDENGLNPVEVRQAWQLLLLRMATDLGGYGIAMRGADMVCRDNEVHSGTGCPAPFQTRRRASLAPYSPTAARFAMIQPWGGQALVSLPAIGGIWQFSNAAGMLIDLYEIILTELGEKDHSQHYIYKMILWAIFFWVLSTQQERSQQVDGNQVE